jgi:hypothetical protein
MERVRRHIRIVDRVLLREINTGDNDLNAELIFLHFRKALEEIAFASLAVVINTDSKAALHDFILEHDISALLCGHVHQSPLVEVRKVSRLKQTTHFLDARCGTTSQRSTVPYDWTTVLGHRPTDEDHWPNSLLVHRG